MFKWLIGVMFVSVFSFWVFNSLHINKNLNTDSIEIVESNSNKVYDKETGYPVYKAKSKSVTTQTTNDDISSLFE